MVRTHTLYGIRPWSRHSLVLAVAGVAYITVGFGYGFTIQPGGIRWEALVVARHWMPLEWWGAVWCGTGVLAIISSRWPPTADKWGYSVLTGLAAGWGAFYAAGVIFGDAPISNYSGAVVWWLLAFMWWAISGLTNPVTVYKIVEVRSDA